ncbi:MAG: NADP-dependent malic enzyme [Alphaproteobacteria bacterium CG1_02_46_17]|nr:MAG: NADP-dependent malic enzyme [Alphaproteobacteria bacterium CG1_02_46_17]
MKDSLREAALEYHRHPRPGKISIVPTKQMTTQRDLSLAYSPGVAFACEEIEKDPLTALDYTSRGNVVAVISNGTAVLGLGAIGALASKPVMEGKSVLFKKFANIDSLDIEIDETDPKKLIEIIASLEPSFGGINLEDIKSPECFEVERTLRERMKIPVFHDDQHGTAIISGAAILNWLEITGRKIDEVKLVASGAGAAAIACLTMITNLGMPKENITVCDRNGVVYKGRNEGMDAEKEKFAIETKDRTLADAIKGANIFLGLSAAGALKKEMVADMADAPLIMALANPTPEIMPSEALEAKPNAVICTGRSDFPNQVNNVLCFPYIFRGALDVGATAINEEMKMACVRAIAALARKEAPAEVAAIYSDESLEFGPKYMIPKPFDPRLIVELPMAVARTAMETGVATRPIEDWEAYKNKLTQFFYQSDAMMRPVFAKARTNPKKIAYCEGEEERVLRATQTVVDENLARPVLVGRRAVIESRIKKLHLRMKPDEDFDLVDPENDARYNDYWATYQKIMERNGVTPSLARNVVRTNTTVIGALMVHKGEADGMICGTVAPYREHLKTIVDVVGLRPGVETAAAMIGLLHPTRGPLFICDTHINPDPSVAQISEMTMLAVEEIRRFGITPKVALISHSNFGSHRHDSAFKMRDACFDIKMRAPELEIDGEMHADCALSEEIRNQIMPNSTLKGSANLLIMPTVDAANITYNAVKVLADCIPVGPILLGTAHTAHILTNAATARTIVNLTAVSTVGAQIFAEHENPTILREEAAA